MHTHTVVRAYVLCACVCVCWYEPTAGSHIGVPFSGAMAPLMHDVIRMRTSAWFAKLTVLETGWPPMQQSSSIFLMYLYVCARAHVYGWVHRTRLGGWVRRCARETRRARQRPRWWRCLVVDGNSDSNNYRQVEDHRCLFIYVDGVRRGGEGEAT